MLVGLNSTWELVLGTASLLLTFIVALGHFRLNGLASLVRSALLVSLLAVAFMVFNDHFAPNWLSIGGTGEADTPAQEVAPRMEAEFALVLLAILTLVYLPRFVLGVAATANRHVPDDAPVGLFPSQWKVVGQLIRDCGGRRGEGVERTPSEGKIISLEARWGDGKTFVLRAFERISNAPRYKGTWPRAQLNTPEETDCNLVVSYYNAWTNQTAPDPEFAIVQHLVGDPRVMWPYGWMTVPAWRIMLNWLLGRFGRGTGFSVSAFGTKIHGSAAPTPPHVGWSEVIARLAHAVSIRGPGGRRGATLVLIVDDIDRCDSIVAQRYVTLLRRGLTLPRLAVVLPYTDDQLRHKVFDPLSVDLPDLGSSMEAAYVNYLIRPHAGRDGNNDEAAQIFTELADMFKTMRKTRSESTNLMADPNGQKFAATVRWADALNSWELMRRELLIESYARLRASGTRRAQVPVTMPEDEKLLRQLESKYIADAPIEIKAPSPRDFAQMILERIGAVERLFPFGKRDIHLQALRNHLSRECREAELKARLGDDAHEPSVSAAEALHEGLLGEKLQRTMSDAVFEAIHEFENIHASGGPRPSIRTVNIVAKRLLEKANPDDDGAGNEPQHALSIFDPPQKEGVDSQTADLDLVRLIMFQILFLVSASHAQSIE